jgi:hypothetical protein
MKKAIYQELKRERYSRTQKIAAVEHYHLTHGGCLSYTRRAISYSAEVQALD